MAKPKNRKRSTVLLCGSIEKSSYLATLGTDKIRVVDVDPDSATLWLRIRIGNPDPGSGSRGKKIKKFQWKKALFSDFKKNLPLKSSVSDPDPHGSAFNWSPGSGSVFGMRIRIRIQEG
jgi:hypothetical protein